MSKSNKVKTLFYLFIFFPTLIILFELISSKILININKGNNNTIYDPLTGWRQNCLNNKNNLICDEYGFIKTPYQIKNKSENDYGILLLGNSVAMGEGLYGFDNKKTFASQLEKHLRNRDDSIDLINGAYSGFNTWQEHVETYRYLNSQPFLNKLPSIDLIVSFGGIQDFWNFINLISNANKPKKLAYSYANGMMIEKNNIDYINYLTRSNLGDLKSGINAFINSIRTKSTFIKLINIINLRNSKEPGSLEKIQLTINPEIDLEEYDIEQILEKRFKIKYKDYEEIKSYAINSVVRNLSANSNLNSEINYFYVYAPTYFSSISEDQLKSNNFKYVIGINHLIGKPKFPLKILEREMKKIEKDYRDSLFEKIREVKSIVFLDYSGKAEDTSWFLDYSHLNAFAADQISKNLSEDIFLFRENK